MSDPNKARSLVAEYCALDPRKKSAFLARADVLAVISPILQAKAPGIFAQSPPKHGAEIRTVGTVEKSIQAELDQ